MGRIVTLNDLLTQSYHWGDANARTVLLASALVPLVGTLLAFIGKGGKTDADGRFIASTVIALAVLVVLVEVGGFFVARNLFSASLLDANALLLLSPVLCLVGSVLGIRMVFPLSELGSVRTLVDLGLFLLACGGAVWLLSRFRGWHVVFFGSVIELLIVAAIGFFFLRRLYRRAFGLGREPGGGRLL